MSKSCQIPSAAERAYGEHHDRIEKDLREAIFAAVSRAAQQARSAAEAAGLQEIPPEEYFAAVAHQKLYCKLCHADPETFEGGRPEVAASIIRNSQNIARHYWGLEDASSTR